jgi:hypothetical protein
MPRTSMSQLIALVRLKTGFTSTGTPLFTDDNIQDVLDAHRADIRYELMTPAPDIQPGQGSSAVSNFVWAVYLSDFQYWENSLVIQGLDIVTNKPWVILTPVSSEYIPGKFAFAVELPAIATPPAQFPPVYATGKVYDIFRASAELLQMGIAQMAFNLFDITSDGRTMRLQQIVATWQKLTDAYLCQAWPTMTKLYRSDIAPDSGTTSLLGNRADWSEGGLLPNAFAPTVSISSSGGGGGS